MLATFRCCIVRFRSSDTFGPAAVAVHGSAIAATAANRSTAAACAATSSRLDDNRLKLFRGLLLNESLQVTPSANTVFTLGIREKSGQRLGQSLHIAARPVRRVDVDSVITANVDELVVGQRQHALAKMPERAEPGLNGRKQLAVARLSDHAPVERSIVRHNDAALQLLHEEGMKRCKGGNARGMDHVVGDARNFGRSEAHVDCRTGVDDGAEHGG